MKIWLINHYAVPPRFYPLIRQTNFAKYLQKIGHEVLIFAASTVHNSDINLIDDEDKYKEVEEEGVHYVLVKCRNYHGNGISRIWNMCEFALKLRSVCKHYARPDAIVATSMPPMSCATGIALAKKYRCLGVAEIADLWPESLIVYGIAKEKSIPVMLLRRLEKWIYTHADKVIFTMDGAYDYIKEQHWENKVPKEKVFFINNGVDLSAFDENREKYTIQDDDLENDKIYKIVYTGSVRKVNNLGILLDVAKRIQDETIKFLIWGDGNEKSYLEQRLIEENIHNVIFKGRVDKKYIPYITSRADLNYMHGESSPLFRFGLSANKLFDYFAAGKPIFSDLNVKYNPITIWKAGIDIEDSSIENIADKILQMRKMPQEEYLSYCRNARIAAENYDFKKLTTDLADILK